MTQPVRLWIETTHHPAFRYGGWGIVREEGGAVSGQAGGERNLTAARIDLLALMAALQGLAPAAAVTISSASPGVVAAARILSAPPAAGSEGAPDDNLDLWAQALKLSSGRALTVRPAQRAPATPAAFCFAWAEVGQDKAKGMGRFSAAIPKPNLAKLPLP
ncbi:MAG: ribonuclease H [Caulobacteraceae bacterium]